MQFFLLTLLSATTFAAPIPDDAFNVVGGLLVGTLAAGAICRYSSASCSQMLTNSGKSAQTALSASGAKVGLFAGKTSEYVGKFTAKTASGGAQKTFMNRFSGNTPPGTGGAALNAAPKVSSVQTAMSKIDAMAASVRQRVWTVGKPTAATVA